MAQTPTKDYYAILGLKKTATSDDIRKAFRKLARKHHPDVNPGDKKAEEKFKEISEANDVLSDDKKRRVYDALGYYTDQIDPATAEAAARGGYGFSGGAPGGGSSRQTAIFSPASSTRDKKIRAPSRAPISSIRPAWTFGPRFAAES
jgi:molecular chaperone DnaJ